MNISRRHFLRQTACAAVGTTSLASTIWNLRAINAATAQTVNANLTLTLTSGTGLENVLGTALGDKFTGNSRANTYYWLHSLNELGQAEFTLAVR